MTATPIGPESLAQAALLRADSLQASIRRQLENSAPTRSYGDAQWKRMRQLYTNTDHRPIWMNQDAGRGVLHPRALQLIQVLNEARSHALTPDTVLLASLRAALVELQREPQSMVRMSRADVLLSAAFVQYATDILTGQVDPSSVSEEWHIDPHDVDVDSALVETLGTENFGDALALLRPQDADYAKLLGELERYRAIVASGGWPVLPALDVLRPGATATSELLGILLSRLHAEEYLPLVALTPSNTPGTARADSSTVVGPTALAVYDTVLASAVARYQLRHGLVVDSVLGPRTRASLNQPAEFRLQQIAANLERHRWMSRERRHRYVVVNVPAFRLRAFDEGREALSMNVVVGAEYGGRSTPVFADSMSYVVFRPYWNVPESIANEELWPKQRADPTYFRRNGYETVNASWGTYVRQKPAPDNALGDVKFIFPNSYAIYLHDTPAQELFAEQVRAFSHGCIRVEHPDLLAEFVLGKQGWTLPRVREAMSGGSTDRRVDLAQKLPVYIVYFTTYWHDDALYFGNDIYDRDDALVRAMRGAALSPDDADRSQSMLAVIRTLVDPR